MLESRSALTNSDLVHFEDGTWSIDDFLAILANHSEYRLNAVKGAVTRLLGTEGLGSLKFFIL